MDLLNFNNILGREQIANSIKNILSHFNQHKSDLTFKRGIYIYGAPGSGKTEFVLGILKELNYDIVKYDAGDIRNKSIIDAITKHTMADKSVISLLNKKAKPIAIVMDEIDGMNNGDKGGINALIRIIRPKKTKKQKNEEVTFNPIICLSSYHVDKKINESSIFKIYQNNCSLLKNEIIQDIFKPKSYNEDTKEITKKLLNQKFSISEHNTMMNETDRTIVGLLWHENIIDTFAKMPKQLSIPFYSKVLGNICFADYMDRITFQKQIWQFNEMSSLIKTFHSNKIYHDTFKKKAKFNPTEIRFTKVLTKYSTEYNNSLFIQNLCQQLGLDKKDTFSFFLELRNNHSEEDIYAMFESYEIGKLDIVRIYRYLDKYTDKNCKSGDVAYAGASNEEDMFEEETI